MAEKIYKLGGMNDPGSADEVDFTLSHIDGVKKVTVDRVNHQVAISFNPAKVTETHLKGTLTALGHGILSDGQ